MNPCTHFDSGVCYSPDWEEPFGEGCLLNHKDSCPHYNPCVPIKVKYKNWRNETSIRTIIPAKVFFGRTDFHKEDQWLLEVFDVEKDALRTYAMQDIIEFIRDGE